jgi:thymidine kinase
MATIHTELPEDRQGHHGEYVVGQTLKTFSNPGLELWFDINYIAGITDLDLILHDNQVGLYLIEIKSMPIDSIETFTMTDFVIKEGQKRQHPKSQLLTGSLKLRDHLRRFPKLKDKKKMPFLQSTVLWSEITRSDWKQRFTDPSIVAFEEMCIFKDDLGSYNKLISALQRLWDRPLLGTATPLLARSEHGEMEEFRKAIAPAKHKIEISKSMTTELSRPVKDSQRIADKYELGKPHKASIQGPPGTGKTTILREIGLRNLAAGARVLHVCFNKVLAADQKREYQILRKSIEEYGFIDVFDIWELYKELGHSTGINGEEQVVENVRAFLESEDGKSFLKYDVILIDESQDLRDGFFQVVEQIARPNAAWFIAYGKGQETNNFFKDESHPSPWLKVFLATSDPNYLKRSFRNSTKAFLLAQSFWEKFPNLEEAKEWLKGKFSQQPTSDNQFELDLEIPQSKNDFKVELLPSERKRKSAIKNLVLSAIEDSRRANRGEDLLVAVLAPSTKKADEDEAPVSSGYELVREVLEEVAQEFSIDFHDLVPKENRRDVPKIGAIRLVTLQGIRGLSASHVIIFDLLQLEKWAKRTGGSIKPPIVNLTYIALSRSKASTIVAIDDSEESEIEPFLMDMLGYATELAIKQGDK